MLQSQTTWKEGSLTLAKTSYFVSLSCLLWWLSLPFFCKDDNYKACSFASVGELSAITLWSRNNAVAATHFRHFWRISRHILCTLTYPHINILWASIRGNVLRSLPVSNPVYISSSIIYGLHVQYSTIHYLLSDHMQWHCNLPIGMFRSKHTSTWQMKHSCTKLLAHLRAIQPSAVWWLYKSCTTVLLEAAIARDYVICSMTGDHACTWSAVLQRKKANKLCW